MGHGGKPWVSDFNHPHYMAGRRALKTGQHTQAQFWGAAGVDWSAPGVGGRTA